jgi:hypothetical protein
MAARYRRKRFLFFFEKKNQKTFGIWHNFSLTYPRGMGYAGGAATWDLRCARY